MPAGLLAKVSLNRSPFLSLLLSLSLSRSVERETDEISRNSGKLSRPRKCKENGNRVNRRMIYGGNKIRRKEKQREVEMNRIMNFKRATRRKKKHRYSP